MTHTCWSDPRNDCAACETEQLTDQDATLVEPEREEDR